MAITRFIPCSPNPIWTIAKAAKKAGSDMQVCSFLLQKLSRGIRHASLALALLSTAGAAVAIEAIAPQVDASGLPEQARQWAEINPVRGKPDASAIG